jgi:cardiolipin synthase A/B
MDFIITAAWLPKLLTVFLISFHILAIFAAIQAILYTRTAQGGVAWIISLLTFPLIALPCYLIFGRRKFHGYIKARRSGNLEINHIAQYLANCLPNANKDYPYPNQHYFRVTENLAKMPFTACQDVQLLIDGEATFKALFSALRQAKKYVILQFFIVRDDNLGKQLQQELIALTKKGITVYFLYDEIGCINLSRKYINTYLQAGIQFKPFLTTRGHRNRLQVNFRNHRKIVIVDGMTAFVGGLNVGDEYLGLNKKIGAWRDTHVQVSGACVQCIQLSFIEDWYWATSDIPQLNWQIHEAQDQREQVLVVASSPADSFETCTLMFLNAINIAKNRLWICSPYFVPDSQIISALQLAALRGVDVRIMLPKKPDHILVYLASFSYLHEISKAGVKIYQYSPGFLHQKVMLIDNDIAAIGTANLDNRSFRLNFEITLLFVGNKLAKAVTQMLRNDFKQCQQLLSKEADNRSFWFRLASRAARLMAPVL